MSARLGFAAVSAFLLLARCCVFGAETNAPAKTSKFLGANSCSSSSCHGGGGHNQNQFLVWSLRDVHHERPFATLTTARSRQIAAALKITNPAEAPECTTCHAPLTEVPSELRGPLFSVTEGVSCENCHGPSENWLRSHTRHDYTHANRIAAGMGDLKDIYVRANTCVTCHQTVALPLLNAGHPELIFELDGQSVAEPKHWRENPSSSGAQRWLTGQAAALREISWQIDNLPQTDKTLLEKRDALLWLFQKVDDSVPGVPKLRIDSAANSQSIRVAADAYARAVANVPWQPAMTSTILAKLAGAAADFRDKSTPTKQQARRAERLVLALDRLANSQTESATQTCLNKLFQLAQSIPDFDSAAFASSVDEFSKTIR